MLSINDADFQRLVKFVHENYGIDLSKKRQLIVGRLSNTILSMGFTDFQQYIDHLIKNRAGYARHVYQRGHLHNR